MKGTTGAVPADHDVITCTDAAGRPGEVVVFGRGMDVAVIVPAGEAAVFSITEVRAYVRALDRRATISEGRARTAAREAAMPTPTLPVRVPNESTDRFAALAGAEPGLTTFAAFAAS